MAGRSLTAFTASTGLMGPFVVPVQGVFSYIYMASIKLTRIDKTIKTDKRVINSTIGR